MTLIREYGIDHYVVSLEREHNELSTVVFESEDEYARFVNYVFDEFQGRGLEFTNIPIPASACIRPWLLESTLGRFSMHKVTQDEVSAARRALRASGRRPFDPSDVANFYVPGIPPSE